VTSLPDEPEIALKSFDSFTRVDTVVSTRHTLGGGFIFFPREIARATMNTFRPPEVTPDFNQSGWSTGMVDRLALASDAVLETTLSARRFEINVNADATSPMVFAPQTASGTFFNDQEREVNSLQWVEALSLSREWRGQHVFKFGVDVQRSVFTGFSTSRPVEIRRLDGSLAERTVFADRTTQDVGGFESAVFGQDRWRLGSRMAFELGLRLDRDAIVERINWSPRAGVSIGVAPEGARILRGGYGKFVQRTPLNVEAFPSFERRTVTRFTPAARCWACRSPTPTSSIPICARLKPASPTSSGTSASAAACCSSSSSWTATARTSSPWCRSSRGSAAARHDRHLSLPGARGDDAVPLRAARPDPVVRLGQGHRRPEHTTISSSATSANPIVRANENNLIPTDVRHRLLLRGTVGLPGKWDFAPILELRSGFPWSAIDEFHDFVGARNRTGRLPVVRTLDFSLARPWRVKKYRLRAGIKVYNAFGSSADRDVQNNLTSPDYGRFFNPIERSIGFVLGSNGDGDREQRTALESQTLSACCCAEISATRS
jgi:hypothetical protein